MGVAEDEIAAVGATVGAAFAGQLGFTASSGPGVVLKQEALGLATMVELPLVVIDVQRAGPSTGSPTKTEQGDLFLSMFGRHSASPMPVIAAATPSDCFHAVLEAAQIAVRYMTPVMVLSDSYLANSAEPWKIPDVDTLPRNPIEFASGDGEDFHPYARDEETLAQLMTSGMNIARFNFSHGTHEAHQEVRAPNFPYWLMSCDRGICLRSKHVLMPCFRIFFSVTCPTPKILLMGNLSMNVCASSGVMVN